jgi:hypothetical protein
MCVEQVEHDYPLMKWGKSWPLETIQTVLSAGIARFETQIAELAPRQPA